MPSSAVLPLNGLSRRASVRNDRDGLDVLRSHNLDTEEFVLLVSTLEPRKNHGLALRAWSKMIRRDDSRPVPRLVCVGSKGWMNDEFYQRLAADRDLADKVTVLVNVSDETLDALYSRCLFTIFPSLYEGWGLPISEALAHGKVPLVSDVASHPEAGGEHAVYFDLDSPAEFQARLDELIYDPAARAEREERIRSARPLRPWSEIAAQLTGHLEELAAQPAGPPAIEVIEPGKLYLFSRNTADRLADTMHSAERCRVGLGWSTPEEWGCWANGTSADLAIGVPTEEGVRYRLSLHLAIPEHDRERNAVTLSVRGTGWSRTLRGISRTPFWETVEFVGSRTGLTTVQLRLSATTLTDFRETTSGVDQRVAGVGIVSLYLSDERVPSQRLDLLEAMQTGQVRDLARRMRGDTLRI